MVKPLVHDPLFLSQVSEKATAEDSAVVGDLLDTIRAHKETCVGMAANMIGVRRRIIVFRENGDYTVMLNPVILKATDAYETEEGCLSLLGEPRNTRRYRRIKVQYQTTTLQTRIKTYTDYTAQIIQHEIDHCNGILI